MNGIDLDIIIQILTILGVVFAVYLGYRKPQESSEKKQILLEEKLGDKATVLAQQEVESKASLLAQQVNLEKELTEKRFSDMQTRIDAAMTLTQNHIHTLDVKMDSLAISVNTLSNTFSNDITKISTILEERLPKKS